MSEKVNIKFIKTHDDAVLPTKAHDGDNCFDLYAVEDTVIPASNSGKYGVKVVIGSAVVPVGITVGFISEGYGFVLRPKSGLGFKAGLQPHLGEIDNGYRGDCGVKMYNFTANDYEFKKGDKVAQIKIEKIYDTVVEWTDSVEEALRGDAGFGSTGK
jgi:dUTP pyrophosphatase